MGNTTPKPLIDANLQYRPVASRHYYTLPANSIERRVLPPPLSFSIEPPRFHPHAKGKNIRLDSQLRRAARKSSFCNGVTFSQRPVRLYEKVRLRLSGVHSGWSGALRFGFTSLDPGELAAADIPKYACPDLVTRPGYWAKALPERLALRDNVLAFWADRHGRVFYSINEGEPVLFHCGLNVGSPLWAIIDIYGITQEVTLLESTFADSMSSSRLSAARLSAYLPQSNHDSANYSNNQLETNQAAAAKMATLQLGHCNQLIPCCSPPSSSAVSAGGPRSPRGPPSPLDTELHFHPVRGSDVILSADRSSACIHFLDSSRTVVFSERPLRVGETLFVQAGHLGLPYFGALLFGVTSCDPSTLRPSDLPADPDVLLDRKEYWVVYRGIPTPSSGDVLSFTLLSNGEVHHGVNGAARGRLLCVDASQVLWVFFTLHGAVNRLRILGTVQSSPISSSPSSSPGGTPDDSDSDLAFSVNRSSSASESSLGTHFYGKNPNPTNDNLNPYPALTLTGHSHTPVTCPCTPTGNLATPNNLSMCSDQINQRKPHNDTGRTCKRQSVTAPSSPLSPPLSPAFSPLELPLTSRNGECTVCFDQEVDTVIYTCGHMCLCNDCGLKLKKQINACCPICRRPIKDVIKTYRP